MKTDGSLSRCPLKDTIGDVLVAVLCACGHNIRKTLTHLRPWLAWMISVVCVAINPPQQRHQIVMAA
jgi:transposase, IS5 family